MKKHLLLIAIALFAVPLVVFAAGDLNSDGRVDVIDLGILLAQWGVDGSGDLNNDNTVDVIDLGILLANWGSVAPPPPPPPPPASGVPLLPVPADGTYELNFTHPVADAVAGDWNGDGILDFAIKSEATGANTTYRVEARLNNGTKLWEFDTGLNPNDAAYSPNEFPLLAWDINGDGKWEAYFQYWKNGNWWHRIVAGETGAVLADAQLPRDWWQIKSMGAISYRGGIPRIVVNIDGRWLWMFDTYNGSSFSLNRMWEFAQGGLMPHDMFRVADVDRNGSDDEILLGCGAVSADGSLRYNLQDELQGAQCGASDNVLLGYFAPSSPNELVMVTGDHNGKHVAASWARDGKLLWAHDMREFFNGVWTHFHTGWIKQTANGGELLVIDRDTPNWAFIDVPTGQITGSGTTEAGMPSCSGKPIKWSSDDYDDCVGKRGELGRADVGGPGCEESWERNGTQLQIEFNTSCSASTPSRWANRGYRQDVITLGSGYSAYWLGGVVR